MKLVTRDCSRFIIIIKYSYWIYSQLQCCGLYSPEDYRAPNVPVFFPPNIPISCCPNYDPDRSELVQEREREFCKAKRAYHENGCGDLIRNVFKETATLVLSVTILLIVLEVRTFFGYSVNCIRAEFANFALVPSSKSHPRVKKVIFQNDFMHFFVTKCIYFYIIHWIEPDNLDSCV